MNSLLMFLQDASGHLMIPGQWIFLSVGAVALFVVFLPVVTWLNTRREEREAFYRADTMRRIVESPGAGANAALEIMREENRQRLAKSREGMTIGGLINVGVGIGLALFFWGMGVRYLCMIGAIPGLVGVALLAYVTLFAPKIS